MWCWSAGESTASPGHTPSQSQVSQQSSPRTPVPQLTARQLPMGTQKAPLLPARHEAGWGQKEDTFKKKKLGPNGKANLAERPNICSPTSKNEIMCLSLPSGSPEVGVCGPPSRVPHPHPSQEPKNSHGHYPQVPQSLRGERDFSQGRQKFSPGLLPNPFEGKLCRNPGSGSVAPSPSIQKS